MAGTQALKQSSPAFPGTLEGAVAEELPGFKLATRHGSSATQALAAPTEVQGQSPTVLCIT